MEHSKKITLGKAAVVLCAIPILIYAYAEGPDAGLSGVPGEFGTCTVCHSGGSGSGSVSVAFPSGLTYTPGVTQHLVVTVADPAQRRWGFQLTARQASSTSTMAGTLTPGSDGYTQVVCTQTAFQTEALGPCPASMPLQYIEHTWNGTRNGQRNSATFAFDWAPPSTDVGNITIYVVGNAANGDGSTGGDHIYTNRYTLSVAQANKPTISQNGVVNAASFQPVITAGSWVTITGTNLAGTTRSWRSDEIVNGALPTQLDNVSVTIDSQPAYVAYISPTQINVQAPSDNNLGPVQVQVTYNGVTSDPATVQLQTTSPAFFLWNGKYTVATRADYSLVGPAGLFQGLTTTPAKPGDTIILWGTGFGQTTPAVPAGQQVPASPLAAPANAPTVTIGGAAAQVVGAALTPGQAGLYQIAVTVPTTLPDGDQPVVVQSAGFQSPSGVFLTVQK